MRAPGAPKQCISVAICDAKSSQKLPFAIARELGVSKALFCKRTHDSEASKVTFCKRKCLPQGFRASTGPPPGSQKISTGYPQGYPRYSQVIHRVIHRHPQHSGRLYPCGSMPLGYTVGSRRCPQGMQRGGVRVSNVDRREARAATAYAYHTHHTGTTQAQHTHTIRTAYD